MKTNWTILAAILFAIGVMNIKCNSFNTSGIKPSNNFITRDYKVGSFDKIHTSAVAEISYTQSTDGSNSLQIYGPDNIVELVNVEVKKNILILNMTKKNIKNNSKLKIKISSPHINEIKSHGVGNFTIVDKFKSEALNIHIEGVGNVNAKNIETTNLNVCIAGVGGAQIEGETTNVTLSAKGVGSINAEDLKAQHVTATSNGVGSISCYATESITARANGVGSISYKGNPEIKNLTKGGVGSIKQQ